MISLFKKTSYRVSAVSLIVIVVMSGVMLTNLKSNTTLTSDKNQATAKVTPTNTQAAATIIPKKVEKKVSFTNRTVSKEIKNSYGILIKFDLVLPVLTGTYSGIETINKYYEAKEKEYIAQKDSDYFNSPGNKSTDFYLFQNII